MAKTSGYEGIKHVIRVTTNEGTGCPHAGCKAHIGGEHFAASVNHLINDHGYTLLNVGTEIGYDDERKPWQSTVAVLGSRVPLNAKRGPAVRRRGSVSQLKM